MNALDLEVGQEVWVDARGVWRRARVVRQVSAHYVLVVFRLAPGTRRLQSVHQKRIRVLANEPQTTRRRKVTTPPPSIEDAQRAAE